MEQWQKLGGGPFFRLARLDCALARTRGAMFCRRGEENLIAFPYAPDAPFPLEELFCFARIGEILGKRYVIYRLNGQNNPIF